MKLLWNEEYASYRRVELTLKLSDNLSWLYIHYYWCHLLCHLSHNINEFLLQTVFGCNKFASNKSLVFPPIFFCFFFFQKKPTSIERMKSNTQRPKRKKEWKKWRFFSLFSSAPVLHFRYLCSGKRCFVTREQRAKPKNNNNNSKFLFLYD